jgi:hypothetical protein
MPGKQRPRRRAVRQALVAQAGDRHRQGVGDVADSTYSQDGPGEQRVPEARAARAAWVAPLLSRS